MTDLSAPEPDANDLAMSDEDREALSTVVADVQKAAKTGFSLKARLQGVKLATAKVVLFTDLEAAGAWAEAKARLEAYAQMVVNAEVGTEAHRRLLEGHDDAEAVTERLRDAAFEHALSVHMRALPQVAFEAAQRAARKAYADDSGSVPDDKREAYFDFQNDLLMGQVITRVINSEGEEAEFDRKTIAEELRDALPVPQWRRLNESFQVLMFNDSVGREATADPGF